MSCPRSSFSTWRCSQGGPARWGERLVVVVVGVVLVRAAGLGLPSTGRREWERAVVVVLITGLRPRQYLGSVSQGCAAAGDGLQQLECSIAVDW